MTPARPSRTAEAVCLMRATEQRVPAADRIVDDPFATTFLGPFARMCLTTGAVALLPGTTTYVAARHRDMDERLRVALRAGVEQVVILGAGYDMRAYRFAEELDGRPVFELDHPATAARKARLLAAGALPAADVRRVSIDFQTQTLDGALGGVGFREGAPTFFVWEGVSMYLTRASVKGTLTTLRRLGGPGSSLAMDFWQYLDTPGLVSTIHRVSGGLLHLVGEPVTFALHPEDAPAFCARLGWEVTDVADAPELERRWVRDARRVSAAPFVVGATLTSPG